MFKDRKDAGQKLALKLDKYRDKKALVLAIPKGGVEVGYYVAEHIRAGFSILISKKLPYPFEPEAGFGAIAEDGSIFIYEDVRKWLLDDEIERIKEEQIKEIKRRIEVLRRGEPLPRIGGRTVILVDDGLAMGSTMRAAIALCKKRRAKKIVVAVPVAGEDIAREIRELVDEVFVLETPHYFQAVAQVYQNWHDISDSEVLSILAEWRNKQSSIWISK